MDRFQTLLSNATCATTTRRGADGDEVVAIPFGADVLHQLLKEID
jgi:hypothetical protein